MSGMLLELDVKLGPVSGEISLLDGGERSLSVEEGYVPSCGTTRDSREL